MNHTRSGKAQIETFVQVFDVDRHGFGTEGDYRGFPVENNPHNWVGGGWTPQAGHAGRWGKKMPAVTSVAIALPGVGVDRRERRSL